MCFFDFDLARGECRVDSLGLADVEGNSLPVMAVVVRVAACLGEVSTVCAESRAVDGAGQTTQGGGDDQLRTHVASAMGVAEEPVSRR